MKKKNSKNHRSSSTILLEIAQDEHLKAHLTYKDLIQALGVRAFGMGFLLFALPCLLPFSSIPGVSVAFSLLIISFALQMILARQSVWLPKVIANRPISFEAIVRTIYAVVPYLSKMEYFLKPRFQWMFWRIMEIITGIVILLLAFFLMLPIPFSNFLFSSIIVVLSLGIIENDGAFILLGYLMFFLCIFFLFFLFSTGQKILLLVA